jgi:cell division protein FtsB
MLNLSSKPLTIVLGIVLIFLQYEIWSSTGGMSQAWHLSQAITGIEEQNKELQEKNLVLAADVEDLKNGDQSIEEHARLDLGMVKKGEIFYQIVN